MAQEYAVTIDNEETNVLADAISITGTVNGVSVAAKLRFSQAHGKKEKQIALIKAYQVKAKTAPESAEKVTL